MTTVNFKAIAVAAEKAWSIMQNSGETSFEDLKKREKQAILDEFIKAHPNENDWLIDGDGDGVAACIKLGEDNRFTFWSTAESFLMYDVRDNLTSVEFELNHDRAPDRDSDDLTNFSWMADYLGEDFQVVNLTPHDVVILTQEGYEIKRYPTTGKMVRVNTVDVPLDGIDGIPVVRTEYTDVSGLPDPQHNTVYLVSVLVAQALKGSRPDVYTPDTGPKALCVTIRGTLSEFNG